ncbi:cytochrome P450 4C1-like [Atheta coriaria]|uniref:cytochrome P450 4C1-like n=1 Tax=Dalotia coriaria TaxID=877792 RepID=UPI0031F416DA
MGFSLIFLICLLVGLILFCIGVELYNKLSETARLINLIPGPPTVPILGNATDIIDNPIGIFDKLRKWSKQYYPVYKLWSSNAFYGIMICAPEDMQTILSNTKHNEKSQIYWLFHDWLGEGLLTSNFDKWQHRRKIITPTFHFNILKRYISVFNKHSKGFVEDIKSDSNKEIDILPHIHKSSLHTIAEAAMGTSLEDAASEKKYRNAIHRMGEITVYRLLRPWFYFYIVSLFTHHFYEERFLLRYLKNFTKKVIDEREKTFKDSDITDAQQDAGSDTDAYGTKKKRLAMLDLLLSAKNKGEITYDGIREEVDTFMFEGHDTISMALQFMLLLLANHPKEQQKLYEEVSAILDDNRDPTYEDLHQMSYMELVIKESLRLYPSVPLISRLNGEEFTASSGHRIPVGSVLIMNIYDTHRLEHIYPEPDKFIPERFTVENSKDRHPYAYLPFSAGSRNCIGQKYAMLNMKCKLAAIVKSFVLLPVDTPESITLWRILF